MSSRSSYQKRIESSDQFYCLVIMYPMCLNLCFLRSPLQEHVKSHWSQPNGFTRVWTSTCCFRLAIVVKDRLHIMQGYVFSDFLCWMDFEAEDISDICPRVVYNSWLQPNRPLYFKGIESESNSCSALSWKWKSDMVGVHIWLLSTLQLFQWYMLQSFSI